MVVPRERVATVREWLPESVVIPEDASGVYGAVHTGFKYACEHYDVDALGYINDDDGLVVDGYRRLLKRFEELHATAVVYGRVRYVDINGAWLGDTSICKRPSDLLALFAEGIPGLTQQGMLFPRACYEGGRKFDLSLKLAADSEWIVQNLGVRQRFVFFNETVAYYRIRPGQLSGDIEEMNREGAVVRTRALAHASGWIYRKLARYRYRLSNITTVLARMKRSGFQSSSKMFRDKVVVK